MQHKAVFTKVRKLINERELADDNLDRAEEALTNLLAKDRQCDWAYGLLAEIQYWRGELAAPKDKLALFAQGVEYGEEAVKINENSLEGNFWLAVNYGMYGNEKGILKSLSLIKPIQRCAERVIEIDESYFYGGPWRVLGRLYDKVPGWPVSIGDKRKALECFEAALEFGPKFYLNHLYIAECYLSLGNKAKARHHLQWIVDAPLSKHHEREDEGYKREARALLKKLD
jgi:tetratricopeptide (TPR) repeat protein